MILLAVTNVLILVRYNLRSSFIENIASNNKQSKNFGIMKFIIFSYNHA